MNTQLRILQNSVASEIVATLMHIVRVPDGPEVASKPLPSLLGFIGSISKETHSDHNILAIVLVYLKRIHLRIKQASTGRHCSRHRMFLACLILAKKYVTDYPIKNQAWVSVDGNFLSLQEINLIERQMLQLLEYKTLVTVKELQLVIPISSGCPIRAKSALGQAAKPTNIIVAAKRARHAFQIQQETSPDFACLHALTSPHSVQATPDISSH